MSLTTEGGGVNKSAIEQAIESLELASALLVEPIKERDPHGFSRRECISLACKISAHLLKAESDRLVDRAPSQPVDDWVKCSERMPTGYDNWVLAWHPEWPRVRLVNWCNARVDSGHWRNEADDICHFHPMPTHWKEPTPPPSRDGG